MDQIPIPDEFLPQGLTTTIDLRIRRTEHEYEVTLLEFDADRRRWALLDSSAHETWYEAAYAGARMLDDLAYC